MNWPHFCLPGPQKALCLHCRCSWPLWHDSPDAQCVDYVSATEWSGMREVQGNTGQDVAVVSLCEVKVRHTSAPLFCSIRSICWSVCEFTYSCYLSLSLAISISFFLSLSLSLAPTAADVFIHCVLHSTPLCSLSGRSTSCSPLPTAFNFTSASAHNKLTMTTEGLRGN